MNKSSLIAALGIALFGAIAVCAAPSTRPNFVIILTDDQGYGDLSCHGNRILKTPNLDRLHAESVRFTDFHVSPFCTPTRAALMTGNHAGSTGAFRTSSGRSMMHRDEKTLADLFAGVGYATGMVGKWHLGDNAPHRPQDRGFQDVVWHRCGGIGQASDYWGNDYFDDSYWEKVSPRLTPVRIDVGNPADNPTVLCSQDWRMPKGNPPWNFGAIRKLPKVTGPWMIEVKKAGRYHITLRQFPEEAGKPVVAVKAELEIAGQSLTQPVEPGTKGVVFEANLPAGPTELVTRLFDENGKAGGAYFTEVEAR